MAEDRLFVGSGVLDGWVRAGRVELRGDVLFVRALGHAYVLEEAVHVVSEVSGAGDDAGWVGSVKPVSEVVAGGAEVLERSILRGDRAYDVAPGFLVSPQRDEASDVGGASSLADLVRWSFLPAANQSDEELLARYLMEKLE
jgi:hypothetical protein